MTPRPRMRTPADSVPRCPITLPGRAARLHHFEWQNKVFAALSYSQKGITSQASTFYYSNTGELVGEGARYKMLQARQIDRKLGPTFQWYPSMDSVGFPKSTIVKTSTMFPGWWRSLGVKLGPSWGQCSQPADSLEARWVVEVVAAQIDSIRTMCFSGIDRYQLIVKHLDLNLRQLDGLSLLPLHWGCKL